MIIKNEFILLLDFVLIVIYIIKLERLFLSKILFIFI